MSLRDWDESYATGDLPWDTGLPDEHLVAFVDGGRVRPGRALEVGCGTGTNAVWLAAHGFDVLGVDLSPRAIEQARARAAGAPRCRFEALDFLADEVGGGPFDLVFDRGCFHLFDDPGERARFAVRVAALLVPGGQWLSLVGSTEGPPRGAGPPRRSARDVVEAIEPSLEIVALRATWFPANGDMPAMPAWACEARKRTEPAQASTKR